MNQFKERLNKYDRIESVKRQQRREETPILKKPVSPSVAQFANIIPFFGLIMFIILGIAITYYGIERIPYGVIAVRMDIVSGEIKVVEGPSWILTIGRDWELYNKTNTIHFGPTVMFNDGVRAKINMHCRYHIKSGKEFYQALYVAFKTQENFHKIIQAHLESIVLEVTPKYSAHESYAEKRGELVREIGKSVFTTQNPLSENLKEVVFNSIEVTNIEYEKTFQDAILRRITAQQKMKEAKARAITAEHERQRTIAEAEVEKKD